MPEKPSPGKVIQLIIALQDNDEAQRLATAGVGLDPGLARLRAWQAQRLTNTYADLLADEHYKAACRFFLDDLYGARDFSQRDQDAARLYAILAHYLPESMLRLLTDALQLNQLSARLDLALCQALSTLLRDDQPISAEAYAEGYRICDNFAERAAQIALLTETLNEAARGARGPLFGVGLRLTRAPAYHAGWQELHAFLERGVIACRPMKDVAYFVDTIRWRETTILENIFARRTAPFEIGETRY